MSTTPGKPRTSGIPAPGRSNIPTPGRLRSSSSAGSNAPPPLPSDSDALDRAFAQAVKANDPARHSSSQNLSPQTTAFRRPPSVASNPRAKTPTSTLNKSTYRRPESRQSDVFSRTQRSFEVGDNVRIESLGFEGTLKYLGEIDGKQGLWAGVEVGGGFAGKGKNDGSVDGRYFQCPPKCGVFVATAKLSPPTVGPGAQSRPSSVASSRASISGRITPSFTGRATPSIYNGRITPSLPNGRVTPSLSNGRITPSSSFGFSTPSAAPRIPSRTTPRHPPPPAINTPSTAAMSKITAGSRASKYVGMTARQLSSRDTQPIASSPVSPSRQGIGSASPTRSISSASPIRALGLGSPSAHLSNASTPKPASRISGLGTPKNVGSGRPSLATPRARIPSAIAMPPPPSPPSGGTSRSVSLNDKPITPTFSSTSNDTAVDDDENLTSIQQNHRVIQDKIQQIMSGKVTPSSGANSPSAFLRDGTDDTGYNQRMPTEGFQNKLDALERDNARLRMELEEKRDRADASGTVEIVQQERDEALSRLQESEALAKTADRALKERESKIESLERTVQASADALERHRSEGEARTKDLQSKLDDAENLVSSLKEALDVKANEAGQNEGLIQAKNAEIALLEARAKKAFADLEEIRQDLGGQVDELRQAGQETIALYEERLSAAETQRYELEDLVEGLEEQVRTQVRPPSPATIARHASEAAQIDNETLREQTVHLQKKIATLEDMLEDTRVTSEKEEVAVRARITRYKDNEAQIKKEVGDARKELERVLKSEASARVRAEEIEEALRENTLALENARAEIEGLRAELANLEGLQASTASPDPGKSEEVLRRAAVERTRHDEEISQLKDLIESTRAAKKEAVEQLETVKLEAAEASRSLSSLQQTLETLDSDKAELEYRYHDQQAKLENDRTVISELRRALDERAVEMESVRKSFNRDRPLNHGLQETGSSPTKHDLAGSRDEIKGLKHIIQELQKENATAANHNKLLESENKMLLSETDQLREELKVLEENIEQSLLHEEKAIESSVEGSVSSDDALALQKTLKETKSRHDMELEHLRKKVTDAEMKNARTIHDLNKEVTELESLIEAKIYREDDLEREIERLKEKLGRSKKSSKSSIEVPIPEQRHRVSSSSNSNTSLATPSDPSASNHEECEICEQPGHDIFTCPLLKDDQPTAAPQSSSVPRPTTADPSDLFCEDCESHGHVAADCPHSLEVF